MEQERSKTATHLVSIRSSHIRRHRLLILRLRLQLDHLLEVHLCEIELLVAFRDLVVKIHKSLQHKHSDTGVLKDNPSSRRLTRTRVCTIIEGVTTALPHPAGISLTSLTTFALLHPFESATIVATCGANSASSSSVCTWMKTARESGTHYQRMGVVKGKEKYVH